MVPESDRLFGVLDRAWTAMGGLCSVSAASSTVAALVAIDLAEFIAAGWNKVQE